MARRQLVLCMFVMTAFVLLSDFALATHTRYVTIGTGGIAGVYYPTGVAISEIVNRRFAENRVRATVESTGGSVFNVNALMVGDLEFGIVQSDRQFQAYNGTADWQGNPQEKLRSVFAIHPESVTLLAAVDAGVRRLSDLKGKRVIIGNPGSGQLGNALDVLKAAGIDPDRDLVAEDLRINDAAKMLQDGRIDAYFYTVGHPNDSFRDATSGKRKTRFVPIDQQVVRQLIGTYSYYAQSEIPVSFYPGVANRDNVAGFGVKATFCTSADVDADIVYLFVRELFENFEEFKTLHPAYSTLSKQGMLEGLSAPLHPGAEKYYREVGLLK